MPFQLAYGTAQPRRWAAAKKLPALTVGLVLALICYRMVTGVPRLFSRWTAGTHRSEIYESCLNYVEKADTLKYDQAAWLTSGAQQPPTQPATSLARLLDRYDFDALGLDRIRCAPGLYQSWPIVLFLHERHSTDGAKRLVVVTFDAGEFRARVPSPLHIEVYSPQGRIDAWCSASRRIALPFPTTPGQPLKFFFGQPDSTDASHFTIDYQLGSQTGTIDGWIRPTDRVDLAVRAPATQPDRD